MNSVINILDDAYLTVLVVAVWTGNLDSLISYDGSGNNLNRLYKKLIRIPIKLPIWGV